MSSARMSVPLTLALAALVPAVAAAQTTAAPPKPVPVAPTGTVRPLPSTTVAPSSTSAPPTATTTAAPVAANRPDATRTPTTEPSCATPGDGYEVDASGTADACRRSVEGSCPSGATWDVDKSGSRDECSKAWPFPIGNTNRSPCQGRVQVALPGRDQCKSTATPECRVASIRTGTVLPGAGRDRCGPSARCDTHPIQVDADGGERDLCFKTSQPVCDAATTLSVDYCKPKMGFRAPGCTVGALGGGSGLGDVCTKREGSDTRLTAPTCPPGTAQAAIAGSDQCRTSPQPATVCPAGTRVVARRGVDDCLP